MRRLSTVLCFIFMLGACTAVPEGIKPVENFDLSRYLGQWYEIARFDHSFERGLSHVTAEYTRRADGGVTVVNRGFDATSGQWDEAIGKAFFVGDENQGHLKVSFFGPFYASYVVMALDQSEYQYALVTGPDRDYLWILARQPSLPTEVIDRLVNLANEKGYDTSALIFVEHSE